MLIDFGSDFGVGSGNSAVHGRGSVGLPRGGGKRPNFFSKLKKIENEEGEGTSKNVLLKTCAGVCGCRGGAPYNPTTKQHCVTTQGPHNTPLGH